MRYEQKAVVLEFFPIFLGFTDEQDEFYKGLSAHKKRLCMSKRFNFPA